MPAVSIAEPAAESGPDGSKSGIERSRSARFSLDSIGGAKSSLGRGSSFGGAMSSLGGKSGTFHWDDDDESEEILNEEEEAMRLDDERLQMPRAEFMRYLSKQINRGKAFAAMPLSIIMVFSYISIIVTTDDPPSVNAVEDSITMDIEENARFAWSLERGHKNIYDVNSLIDFWSWMSQGMVPLIFGPGEYYAGPGELVAPSQGPCSSGPDCDPSSGPSVDDDSEDPSTSTTNPPTTSQIGPDDNESQPLRLLQEEGGEEEEEEVFIYPDWGDDFDQEVFPPAYREKVVYTSENYSKRGTYLDYNRVVGGIRLLQERFEHDEGNGPGDGCGTDPTLFQVYGMRCWGGKGYEADPEVWDARLTPMAQRKRLVWMFLGDETAAIHQQVFDLESSGWLDARTLKIEVAIPIYNAEYGIHLMMHCNFFFSRGGHIWKDIIPLSVYADWFDTWQKIVYDALFCACLLWVIGSQAGEIYKVLRKRGCVGFVQNYVQFWNMVDWISVLTASIVLLMFGILVNYTEGLNKTAGELGSLDEVAEKEEYRIKLTRVYILNLEDAIHFCHYFRLVMALYPLLLIWRLLKAFSAQPRLAVVTRTLAVASVDLAHFGFLFFIIFSIYAMSGLLLFGRALATFSQIWRVYYAIFLQMLGVFDWDALKEVGRMEAGIWFWIFMILVSLIMLNMLIALVMDAYEEVKSKSIDEETLFMSCMAAWRQWRGVRQGKLVKLSHIRKRLKRHMRKLERERNQYRMQLMLTGEFDPEKPMDGVEEERFSFTTVNVSQLMELVPKIKREQAVSLLEHATAWAAAKHESATDKTTSLQDQLNDMRITSEVLVGNLKEWGQLVKYDPYDGVTCLSDVSQEIRHRCDSVWKDIKRGHWWFNEPTVTQQQLFAARSKGTKSTSMTASSALAEAADMEDDYDVCVCGEDFAEDALYCDHCGRKRPEHLARKLSRLQAEVVLVRGEVGEVLSKVSDQQRAVRHAEASRAALEDAERRLLRRSRDLERLNKELSTRLPYVLDPDLSELYQERDGGRPEILQQLMLEQRQLLKQLEEKGISPTGVFAAAQAAVAAKTAQEDDGLRTITEDDISDL